MESAVICEQNQMIISTDRVVNQEQVKEELKCRICLGILRNPMECKQCETCFCQSCLEQWLNQAYICPLKCSEQPKFRSKAHKIIRNMLSDLSLYCRNQENGCSTQLKYYQVIGHEQNDCSYQLIKCSGFSDGCKVKLIKKEIIDHEKICLLVPVQCEYCKKMIKRSGIKAHWMYCEDAELSCEFCKGIFKKKNYLIHVNALCEEYVMSCGRCSGTFKRKYKEFHDCIRHLQNCQKTMKEEIQNLKETLIDKDKKICDLENKIFFEISDLKKMVTKLNEENQNLSNPSSSRVGSINDQIYSHNYESQSNAYAPIWNQNQSQLFEIQDQGESARLQIQQISLNDNLKEQIFGFVFCSHPMENSNIVELECQQNMTTNFIPMYYIIGVISQIDIEQLQQINDQNFDSIYYLLSPKCCFIPSFGKSFYDKMKFSLRKIKKPRQNESEDKEIKLEIEEVIKREKQKIVIIDQEVYTFFGVFCSSSLHMQNYKEIKVKIY